MGITAEILTKRAEGLGLPIAKDAFEGTLEDPVPEPPYLVYLIPHMENRGADMLNNLVAEDWSLELYTTELDGQLLEIAERIEKEVLAGVDYEKFIEYIAEEGCYQTAYDVRGLIRKVKGAKKA